MQKNNLVRQFIKKLTKFLLGPLLRKNPIIVFFLKMSFESLLSLHATVTLEKNQKTSMH